MLLFDEAVLLRDLARVGKKSLVAFAASCSERLLPAYDDFCKRAGRGSPGTLARILEGVWQHLLGNSMSGAQIREMLNRSMELIPGENNEPWVDEQAYADDAASATAYTLRALDSGEPQEAAWAARRAYEAADHYVIHRLRIEEESDVLAHAIVQAELSRQRRDLEELLGVRPESAELIAGLRARAKADAPLFFASTP
jgi:uncharacterized protein YjaG (DUF416 family)